MESGEDTRNQRESITSLSFDLTGQTFGRLTVLKKAEPQNSPCGSKQTWWLCECNCEEHNKLLVTTAHLTTGHTKSCGCLRKDFGERFTKHGDVGTRLYNTWQHMKRRCNNPKDKSYQRYGGRGITVCDEWNGQDGYIKFKQWALSNGYEDNLTIDRINNDKGYYPENCRWVNQTIQGNNTSTNQYITFKGETHTYAEWGKITGLDEDTIQSRIKYYHMTPEQALTKPNSCCINVNMYDLDNNFLKSFTSLKEAAEYVGGGSSNISYCLKGKTQTAYGYKWKYGEPKILDFELTYDSNYITDHTKESII